MPPLTELYDIRIQTHKKKDLHKIQQKMSCENLPAQGRCMSGGCRDTAFYKAPRLDKKGYDWLCLIHIREYNARWNYFKGFTAEQLEAYFKASTTGHRPTRPISTGKYAGKPYGDGQRYEAVKLTPDQKKALSVLGLEYPFTLCELKKRYKACLKRYHPDLNNGNRSYEQDLTNTLWAYDVLLNLIENG